MAFHPEQRDAGFHLINRFTEEQPFSVLLAQMQSGKTGAYLYTSFEMVRRGIVERVVIICGSSDTSLRDQTKMELEGAYDAFLMETMRNQDLDGAMKLGTARQKFGVFFSQDLKSIDDIGTKTLIIHDESHMAQSKNNTPYKAFYQKNKLADALMGDFTLLNEKNNYILGVSATPFSEIVSNKKVQTGDWTTEESELLGGVDLDPKNFFFMQPGQGYIGVPELLLHNSIKFEAENIKTDDCDHIASILRKGTVKYHKKYVVVRSHMAEKDKDMMETIATSCGYKYVSVFGGSGGGKTSLDFMENEPFDKTLVHICGRFRMGQVVSKRFIAMVYEQSVNPNADTILQGLVGRMCGYQVNGSHLDVDIYVSLKAEEIVRKYGRAWSEGNMDTLSEVTKAMNLGGVTRKNGGQIVEDENGNKWIKTVPVKFKIEELDEEGVRFTKITPEHLLSLFREHPQLIEGNPDKEDIIKLLGDCASVRPTIQPTRPYLHHNNAKSASRVDTFSNHFTELDNAISEQKRLNISHYTGKDIKKLNDPERVRFSPISLYGSDDSDCYLMGHVLYKEGTHPPETVELATVDPMCNYMPGEVTMEDDTVLDNVNGGQIITFSLDTADDPDSLETELRGAILRTKEDHPSYIASCDKSIHSLFDNKTRLYEGIRLCKSVYTEESIETLKNSLNRELSVNLKFTKSPGRQPKGHHKLSSISW
tara:strand:- start:21 stop:2138 length:2118 start_codon:yes stop_codon:yes gene_type:complete